MYDDVAVIWASSSGSRSVTSGEISAEGVEDILDEVVDVRPEVWSTGPGQGLSKTRTDIQVFLVSKAWGGGTDFGLVCLLWKRLSVDCEKESKLSFAVRACPHNATAFVEQDNTILSVRSLLEYTDVAVKMDIEARTSSAQHTSMWNACSR